MSWLSLCRNIEYRCDATKIATDICYRNNFYDQIKCLNYRILTTTISQGNISLDDLDVFRFYVRCEEMCSSSCNLHPALFHLLYLLLRSSPHYLLLYKSFSGYYNFFPRSPYSHNYNEVCSGIQTGGCTPKRSLPSQEWDTRRNEQDELTLTIADQNVRAPSTHWVHYQLLSVYCHLCRRFWVCILSCWWWLVSSSILVGWIRICRQMHQIYSSKILEVYICIL